MAKSPQEIAEQAELKQRMTDLISARNARAKETGVDLNTARKQIQAEQHQASLKRLYGDDLDTSNPAAVNAARAAKQAAAAQSRMDARQIRDADFAAKQKAAEKQTAIDDDAYNQRARQAGLDRAAARGQADAARRAQAQAATIARMEAAKAAAPPRPQEAPPRPQEAPMPPPRPPMQDMVNPTPPMRQQDMVAPPPPTREVAPPRQSNDTGFVERTTPMKRGGRVKKMASGGMTSKVSSASKRGDGIAQRGKTRGRYI